MGTNFLSTLLSTLGSVKDQAEATGASTEEQQQAVNIQAAKVEGMATQKQAQDQQVLAKSQQVEEMIARAMQLSPDQADNAVVALATERVALEKEQKALYEEVRAKQKLGFFDDPLAYIVNRYTINDTIEEHNAVVDRRNTVTQNLSTLAEVTTNAKNAAMFGTKATDALLKKAESDQLAFMAETARLARTKELAGFNINADAAVLHASGVKAEMDAKALAAMNTAESLQMQRETHRKQMLQFDQLEKDDAFWGKVATTLGDKYYNGATLPVTYVKQLYNSQGPEGEVARWAVKSIITGSGLGDTPGEAAIATNLGNLQFKNEEQKNVAKWLASETEKMLKANPKDAAGWKSLKPTERAALIDNALKQRVITPVEKGTYKVTPDSVYAAPTVGNLLSFMDKDSIEGNTLWKEVLQGLPSDKPLEITQVLKGAQALLVTGKYGALNKGALEAASTDIVNTYKMVNKYNAEEKGLKKVFNLPLLTKSYNVSTGAGIFDTMPSEVDAVNPVNVRRALLLGLTSTSNTKQLMPSVVQGYPYNGN